MYDGSQPLIEPLEAMADSGVIAMNFYTKQVLVWYHDYGHPNIKRGGIWFISPREGGPL